MNSQNNNIFDEKPELNYTWGEIKLGFYLYQLSNWKLLPSHEDVKKLIDIISENTKGSE